MGRVVAEDLGGQDLIPQTLGKSFKGRWGCNFHFTKHTCARPN